jgi:hypothetical protein
VQNIDPVILLEPILFIALGAGLVVWWRVKRRLTGMILLLSLISYAAAIALKEVVQAFTANAVTTQFGFVSLPTGLYYGLQTCFFEVGLAYLVARYAASRKVIGASDGEGYGVALAFWENAILLGALSLVNLATTYLLIQYDLIPQSVYQTVASSSPGLFYTPGQLAVPIALAFLERVSSFLAHFAWGYLCVFAAVFKKPVYLAVALPMGLIDALVPFAQEVPTYVFEGVFFAICLSLAALAWRITRSDRLGGSGPVATG